MTSPGRFPTVIQDPGGWWYNIAGSSQHECTRFSLNYHWWRHVCSPDALTTLLAPLHLPSRISRRVRWAAKSALGQGLGLDQLARAASRSLDALESDVTFRSQASYIGALAPLVSYLRVLNNSQGELAVDFNFGPHARDVNYEDSSDLRRAAGSPSYLKRTIHAALNKMPADAELVTISMSSTADLLTSLITCAVLREVMPNARICLVDHGFENFSLHTQMDDIRRSGVFDELFDHIVVSKDDRDEVMPILVEALSNGGKIDRYLVGSLRRKPAPADTGSTPPPIAPAFAPEPIMNIRLSERRCYWSRCTYCTQNSKYEDPRAPSRSDILGALGRLERFVAHGCRHFIFADEALSPSTLRLLAREIEARNLKISWACRCKIELAHDAALFDAMGRAGCYEILFGIESTSPRVLKMMDKYVENIDEDRLGAVFRQMNAAGIGVHVNLIGGYPGETVDDTRRTFDFMKRELAELRGATYFANAFALLPDTPMSRSPNQFGLVSVSAKGDMSQELQFELAPNIAEGTAAAASALPHLVDELNETLGWASLKAHPVGAVAHSLYFGSGHGSIFKAKSNNPFANPLSQCGD